jgi:hypothetical protein
MKSIQLMLLATVVALSGCAVVPAGPGPYYGSDYGYDYGYSGYSGYEPGYYYGYGSAWPSFGVVVGSGDHGHWGGGPHWGHEHHWGGQQHWDHDRHWGNHGNWDRDTRPNGYAHPAASPNRPWSGHAHPGFNRFRGDFSRPAGGRHWGGRAPGPR